MDIGANIGAFAVRYADVFKKIVCFEPNSDALVCLEHNLRDNEVKNVTTHCLAVSDKRGQTVKLYGLDEGEESHSGNCGTEWANAEKVFKDKLGDEEFVQTTDLEEVFRLCETEFIDYMKIDCEGAECKFLLGKDLSKINYIVGEFHPGITQGLENELWDHMEKTHKLDVYDRHCFFVAQKRKTWKIK